MKRALIIIAPEGYQDAEYAGTRKGLEQAEYDIVVASKHAGQCSGKLGGTEEASVALNDVKASDYDCIAFIGGPGTNVYFSDAQALRIAHEAAKAQMPLGAICIAPVILAKAKALSGKRATVWDSGGEQAGILERYGAQYTGEDVTRDGMIVTANGPPAAEEFGRTLGSL